MYWKNFRVHFLNLTFSAGILVSGLLIIFPNFGQPQNRAFTFPEAVPLPQWRFKSSHTTEPPVEKYQQLLSQRSYQYTNNGLTLSIEMRYLQNLYHGDIDALITKYTAIKPSSILRYHKRLGYYGVGVDKQQAYLSACINPQGGSTFTHAQYRHNLYFNGISFDRLLPVLQGHEALIDKRCLWSHLSIPLHNSSPENTYEILEQAWFAWYNWWQPRFPKPGIISNTNL
ncbi:cyanoexosortase A system-associated protein [Anabaena sp. CA = ATCC 33047]|uniref:cyanoexosortase A system-associated protein n=1 Tax=Anabaena sp. (strain CA / ATCC 33047) TaxID=52271 RepID=UPI0008326167|nr:cyanoexosortase A system-associated protein [Anabaena sp. CA = ATCC 33047]